MRNEKKRLYVSIEQLSSQTEWAGWFKEVLLAAAQVSLYRIETWEPFKSLSDNTMAVRWLTKQIRLCNPLPPEKPQQEVVFYILAAYCSGNQFLGIKGFDHIVICTQFKSENLVKGFAFC